MLFWLYLERIRISISTGTGTGTSTSTDHRPPPNIQSISKQRAQAAQIRQPEPKTHADFVR
jgi:hypothetical protein